MRKYFFLVVLLYTTAFAAEHSSFVQKNIDSFEKENQYIEGWVAKIAWGTASYEYGDDKEGFEWFCWSDSLGVYNVIVDLEISKPAQILIKFIFPWITSGYEGGLEIGFTKKQTFVTIFDGWYDDNCNLFHNKKDCQKMSIDYKINSLSDMPAVKNIKVIEYF